ncbi:supporter of activation of yellow protein isoform X2 [Anopheles darlingi]|uniref:supporter of activation of yellow protein isoform X2 n=1 Tax=Anopheles darlingi TaxID=43151 RepID=UPI0020FFFCEA|nr:supporter of activation of yellow protein isoform X2 [Anopheles darlingi]
MVDSCPLQAVSFENVPLAQANHNELHAENDAAVQETRRECHRQEQWQTDSEVQVTKMSSGSVSPAAELTQHHQQEGEEQRQQQQQQQQQQKQQVVVAIDLESAAHDKVISNYHHQLVAQEQDPGQTEHNLESITRLLPEHAEQQQQQHQYQATDERSVSVLADSNGELHQYQQPEGQEARQSNPSPTPTDAMRHPQESHHRPQPLGEVESGEESDCVVVAATTAERKVEPLKINLARDREPIRTIIKLPGAGSLEHHSAAQLSPTIREIPGSPKITIKPPKPPPSATATTDSALSGGGGNGDHSTNSVPASNIIPKLTIKPLINPALVEEAATADDPTAAGANASGEQMHIIPKLLIKGSSSALESGGVAGRDVGMEPHIVPKLTIRGVNNHNHHHHHHHHQQQHQHAHHHSQQQPQPQHSQSVIAGDVHSQPPQHAAYSNNVSSATLLTDGGVGGAAGPSGSGSSGSPNTPLVPKLTIKMDNHYHHGHVQQHGSMENATIPKLHIKTIPPDGSGGVLLLTTASATSSMAAGALVAGTSSTSSGGSSAPAGSSPVLTSSEGVKLTIKPLPEQPKLPKLTIKTTGLGTIAETSDASLVSSTSSSFSPKTELQVLVATPNSGATTSVNRVQLGSPSTTGSHHHHHQYQHHHQAQLQPSSPSDQHSNISSSSIPKLTIKPMPAKQAADFGAGSVSAGDLPTVPKLTIKPIPPPSTVTKQQLQQRGDIGSGSSSNSSSITTIETSINALEPSSVSSSSANAIITMSPTSSHSPTTSALKMKIKVPPAVPSGSSESSSSNSALMAALSGPLLATGSGATSGASNMTRLNIKPILPPGLNACSGMSASEQHRMILTEGSGREDKEGTSGASTPPSGEEEQDPSVPIIIPKVTIKTLANPSGQETEIISTPKVTLKPIPKPSAHQSESVLGTESGRNASPVTTDAQDSPRIILKINKGSSSTTTTSNNAACDQQTLAEEGMMAPDGTSIASESSHHPHSASSGSSLLANELKRPATASASGKVDHSALSSSSSASCASSTSVSVSTSSSSSGGSDPASPSSGSGGDHGGDPGFPEAKKSKLDDRIVTMNDRPPIAHSVLQQTLQQQNRPSYPYQHHQQQHQSAASAVATTLLQRRPAAPSSASDVIIIDDDSKSGNETPGNVRESETPPPSRSTVAPDALANSASSRLQHHLLEQEMDADIEGIALNAAMTKPRRTRGTPRGGRQSRRGTGGRRGAMQNAAARAALNHSQPALSHSASLQGRTPNTMYLMHNEERDEGSSSDCMIVDEPSSAVGAARTTAGGSGSSSKSSSSSLTSTGSGSLYNNTVASGSEVEKNGTASNSSVGSVASSTMGHLPSMTPTPASSGTPGAGVRMSTRRGAGQLLKEVLANKTQDRDSGVDEARTDGEAGAGGLHGPTPSKRPRGRPKKQMVELGMMETNGGGGSSNSIESLMTMMTSDGILLTQPTSSTREDTTPSYPSTPARTPRTRGRGRGRGRGRAQQANKNDMTPNLSGSFFASPSGLVDPNVDPLFIASNTIPSAFGSESDGGGNFNQLFHSVQTPPPRTGRGSRGPRRGGGRGSRTPRGGGRGAAKAAARIAALEIEALAAVAAAGGDSSCWSPSAELGSMINAHQTAEVSPFETPKVVGRRPRGRGASAGARRSATAGRTPRGKKAAALAVAAFAALESAKTMLDTVGDSPDAPNNIFMTPMAGGLELFRSKLNFRELKTPKNAIKSNTPLSGSGQGSGVSPLEGATPTGGSGTNLQLFEEDTRMSGDLNYTTPVRLMNTVDGCLQQNEESQSSYLSSTSVTQDASNNAAVAGTTINGMAQSATPDNVGQKDGLPTLSGAAGLGSNSNSSRRPKGKMEVLDVHRAQFTVDLLAEYEWPPPIAGQRSTDSFMIQEQIAEYLGVKSFKRKYPDLMRRPVEMEERNFILERGLASEKMCDLGLTAVYASEILDIMCTDYPEKYEEYTRYIREKHIRELSSRQRQQQEAVAAAAAAAAAIAAPIDRAQLQKDKAIESAASWNSTFNKDRRDMRRACMDLQTYVVHVPRRCQNPLVNTQDSTQKMPQTTNYPVALVPGQFSEYYTTYTPEELACYPINTVLLEPQELEAIVSSERYKRLAAEEARRLAAHEAGYSSSGSSRSSSSSSGSSSDSDGSSSSSSDSDSNDSSEGSGTSSCSEDDGRGSTDDDRHSRGSASSGTLSGNGGIGDDATKGRRKRLRRKRRDASRMMPMRAVGGSDEHQKNVKPTAVVTPVRRSSRALSAGTIAPVVEVKAPTDSDDSDVPLIAHATKKKNAAAALTATASSGKQMVEVKQEQPTMKRPPLNPFMCAVCSGPENINKYCKPERFVRCNRCRRKAHPSCIGMSSVMYRRVQQYKWQCSECKLCMKCNRKPAAIDSKMVYCDQCDRGYHLACKGLRNLPDGRWHCSLCTICSQCGAQTPEGHPNAQLTAQQRQHLAMVAEWTHEYGINALTQIREHLRTLCVPCMRQRKQRLQLLEPELSQATTATLDSNDNKGTLNNNNTIDNRSRITVTEYTGDHRKLPPTLPVRSMPVGVAANSLAMGNVANSPIVPTTGASVTIRSIAPGEGGVGGTGGAGGAGVSTIRTS